jgi:hypothetical protein
MSNSLRRIYNSINRLFDTRAIFQELRYSREGGESCLPKSAFQTFQSLQPVVLADFIQQGLDITQAEFSPHTGKSQ